MFRARKRNAVTADVAEAIEWLREWGAAGFPRRVDGRVPDDYLTAMRRLTGVSVDDVPTLRFEDALLGVRKEDGWRPRPDRESDRA